MKKRKRPLSLIFTIITIITIAFTIAANGITLSPVNLFIKIIANAVAVIVPATAFIIATIWALCDES
jgi:hypothetical protein